MYTTKIKNYFFPGQELWLAPVDAMPEDASPTFVMSSGRVGAYPSVPENFTEVNPMDTAAKIATLAQEVARQFHNVEDIIDLLALATATGSPLFLRSLPGAAKTRMIKKFAAGISGRFHYAQLNEDTTTADIVGMMDPLAFRDKGILKTRWANFADLTNAVIYADEFFLASKAGQQAFMTLMADKVTPAEDLPMSQLVLTVIASNGLPKEDPGNAVLDRLEIRHHMPWQTSPEDVVGIATSMAGMVPLQTVLSPEEILILQAFVQNERINLDEQHLMWVMDFVAHLEAESLSTSPRRRNAWIQAGIAKSMLMGKSVPEKMHFVDSGKHMLWIREEDAEKATTALLLGVSADAPFIHHAEAGIEKARKLLATASNMHDAMDINREISKAQSAVSTITDPEETDRLTEQIQALSTDLSVKSANFRTGG